jgi:dienelactone hydrolase
MGVTIETLTVNVRIWLGGFHSGTPVLNFRFSTAFRDSFTALAFALLAASVAWSSDDTAAVAAPNRAPAPLSTGWITALYQRRQADQVALSPDGRHFAYSGYDENGLALFIINLDRPGQKTKIEVADNQKLEHFDVPVPPRLRFLQWATADRLVFAPTPLANSNQLHTRVLAPVYSINADGSGVKTIADTNTFTEQTMRFQMNADPDRDTRLRFGTSTRFARLIELLPSDPTKLLVDTPGSVTAQGNLDLKMQSRNNAPSGFSLPLGPPEMKKPTLAYTIDVNTGEMEQTADEENIGQFSYDDRGEPELVYVTPAYGSSRTYQYQRKGKWHDLAADWPSAPRDAFTLSVENYFGEHAYPLGFDHDANLLYIASNIGRDTFAIESLNIRNQERRVIAEDPQFDLAPLDPAGAKGTLVFDRRHQKLYGVRGPGPLYHTAWLDAEFRAVQELVEKKCADSTVQIVAWDDAGVRFVCRVTNGSDPGGYYLFDRRTRQLSFFLRTAPTLRDVRLHESEAFEFASASGAKLSGFVTKPRAPFLNPPALIIVFPSALNGAPVTAFDAEAQVLAEMGALVVRMNTRGISGFGAKFRDGILEGLDTVPIDDALETMRWLADRHRFDRRRVAVYGEGFGGWLALRALQTKPDIFRCGVVVNATLDLDEWIRPHTVATTVNFGAEVKYAYLKRQRGGPLEEKSILKHPELVTKPIFQLLVADTLSNSPIVAENRKLRAALKHGDNGLEYVEVAPDFSVSPPIRAQAYRQLQEFLNYNLYDYKVQFGEVRETK